MTVAPVYPSSVRFVSFRPRPGRITMPDVCCDLYWRDEKLWLSGPLSRGVPVTSKGQPIQLLNLDPLVARAWLGIPLGHITDRDIPLADIDTAATAALSEMFFTGTASQLVGPLAPPPPRYRRMALAAALLRSGRSVGDAALRTELSVRQLERLFHDAFGLSPVQYRRILRFGCSLDGLRAGNSLADVAALAGFADQSHFNREVRDLTGLVPTGLLANVAKVQDLVVHTRDY